MINLELLVILLIFGLSYYLILKNFRVSVYLLLILSLLLHKELFSFYRWDLMPIRAYMLALLCAGITKVYFWLFKSDKKKKLQDLSQLKDPYIIILSLLWLVRGISIYFSKNLQSSLLLFGFFTTIVVFVAFIIPYLKKNPEEIIKYLKFYVFAVFGLTLFGYFQYVLYLSTGKIIGAFWNIPGNIARVGATFWDVNHYGALLAAILPITAMFVLIEKSIKTKLLYFFMSFSMLITLFLTNSRTAWMIAVFSALTFVMVFLIKKWGFKSLSYLFITLVLIALPLIREYSIKDSKFRAEIKQYFHYRMDSFDSHILLLQGSLQIFSKYPILGGGYGGFFEHFSQTEIAPTFFGRDPAALNTRVPAHTIWGEVLAETGVIGYSIWILFCLLLLGTLLKAVYKASSFEKFMFSNAMFSVLVGWLIAGIFYSYNSEFFWIILCLFFSYGVYVLKEDYGINKLILWFSKSQKFVPLILILISFPMIFGWLGSNHLVPWDESIYAKISKNMVLSNDYLVMKWQPDKPWYEKPPLYMWLMAFSMKLFDFTSYAAKLPSAIFGFLTLLVIYSFAQKLFNRTSAFLASFVLLTTVHFLYYSRMAMTDITNIFFMTYALYLYYLAKETEKLKYWIFSGLFIGLAVMTKGVIGFIPYVIIGLYELYLLISKQQKIDLWLIKKYLSLFMVSVVVFLPWHLEMYKIFGMTFINQYLGYHVIARATEAIEDKGQPWWWYFVVMKVSMRIWFVALLASLPWFILNLVNNSQKIIEKNKYVLLTIWSVFIIFFFSIAKSKLVWYILPVYPVLAIIVGRFLERCLNFLMQKYAVLDNYVFKFSAIFLLVVFSLMYILFNKELVYPTDLTGPQARLMILKDQLMGTERKLFVDRIELPLVMFYSNSPFEIIDYQPEKGRTPTVFYQDDMIVLAKRGRYNIPIPGMKSSLQIVGEEKDWVLFYYDSAYKYDKDQLKNVRQQISLPTNTPSQLNDLRAKEALLVKTIDESKGKTMNYLPSLETK